jgi:SAM-dependent methyltransferase
MYINKSVLERGLQPNSLFAFFHCQRTGGSNLLRWFNSVFSQDAVFSFRTSDRYIPWQKIKDPNILDNFKLVGGFAYYKDISLTRPVVCLSIVRHPLYRTVSLYRLARLKSDHFAHDVAMEGSFEDFYREGAKRKPTYFHNLACQRIGNAPDAEIAIRSMENAFGIVATTAQLEEMTTRLIELYGWGVGPMAPGKEAPDEVRYKEYLDSPLFDDIVRNNAEDIKLYEYVAAAAAMSAQVKRESDASLRCKGVTEVNDDASNYEKQDADFIAFQQKHPEIGYAQYQMERVAQKVREGAGHHSLGANIVDPAGNKQDFWVAGAAKAKKYMVNTKVQSNERVVEYGCGSLRIGAHFIKYLDPGMFYGVDVTDGFYEIGKALIGELMIAEKRPRFDIISEATIEKLAAFAADFVYSSAVCCHVHPDEIGFYFAALDRITRKAGALLIFDATLADKPVRYRHRSWAWPLEFLKNSLPDLELVEVSKPNERTRDGHAVSLSTLKFRRLA